MNRKITFATLVGITAILGLAGCYNDNMDEVYPGAGLFTPCDTTSVMSYSTHIVPILQNNCISCHTGPGGSGGVQLDTYSGVQSSVPALIGVTWHEVGYTHMPPNLQLDSCSLVQLKKWVNAGAPNN